MYCKNLLFTQPYILPPYVLIDNGGKMKILGTQENLLLNLALEGAFGKL